MQLTTQRLIIRPIQPDDKAAIFAYRSDAIANKFQSWIPKNIGEVEAFIAKNPKAINTPETWFQLVILIRETNQLIGDIGVHFIDAGNQQAEIGCTLSVAFQAQGYATEALKGVINYLFNELDKHRVIASIDPDNTSSIKLVERLGLRKEGHFKESLFWKGKWVDDIIYAILSREWHS